LNLFELFNQDHYAKLQPTNKIITPEKRNS